MQELVQQAADSSGIVHVETETETETKTQSEPQVEVDFNIRDDSFQLFESEDGKLYVKTDEMPQDVHAEIVPTATGPTAQIAVGIETASLSLCEPADRAETPDVNASANSTVIMD